MESLYSYNAPFRARMPIIWCLGVGGSGCCNMVNPGMPRLLQHGKSRDAQAAATLAPKNFRHNSVMLSILVRVAVRLRTTLGFSVHPPPFDFDRKGVSMPALCCALPAFTGKAVYTYIYYIKLTRPLRNPSLGRMNDDLAKYTRYCCSGEPESKQENQKHLGRRFSFVATINVTSGV